MDTRFFKTSKNFYKKVLIKKYLGCDESKGIILEYIFYNALHGRPQINSFKYYPAYQGISGSSGKDYNRGLLKYLVRSIQLKMGYLDI